MRMAGSPPDTSTASTDWLSSIASALSTKRALGANATASFARGERASIIAI